MVRDSRGESNTVSSIGLPSAAANHDQRNPENPLCSSSHGKAGYRAIFIFKQRIQRHFSAIGQLVFSGFRIDPNNASATGFCRYDRYSERR